ncbi:MAG: hypothetical protein KBG33_04190, partial [Paludibacteraceae bacterium]|nr:hypothetical protein [Paludibacteraceae bacterium]
INIFNLQCLLLDFNPDYSLANLKGKSSSEQLFHTLEKPDSLFNFKAILRTILLLIFQNMHLRQKFKSAVWI